MIAFVVDTNVAVVANRASPQAGPQCVLACIAALRTAKDEIVVLDDGMRILREYMNNLNMAGQPGVGDMFMKWVFINQAVSSRCELVPLTRRSTDPEDFNEFPGGDALSGFDRSDRKFVAVALASRNNPKILNAVDSDWWEFRVQLVEHGLRISFLCPNQFDEK